MAYRLHPSDSDQCQRRAYLFIGFQMIHEIIQSIYAFFYSEVELMVAGAQLMGYLPGCEQVWCPLNPNAEGVKGMRAVKGILGLFEMPVVYQTQCHSQCIATVYL